MRQRRPKKMQNLRSIDEGLESRAGVSERESHFSYRYNCSFKLWENVSRIDSLLTFSSECVLCIIIIFFGDNGIESISMLRELSSLLFHWDCSLCFRNNDHVSFNIRILSSTRVKTNDERMKRIKSGERRWLEWPKIKLFSLLPQKCRAEEGEGVLNMAKEEEELNLKKTYSKNVQKFSVLFDSRKSLNFLSCACAVPYTILPLNGLRTHIISPPKTEIRVEIPSAGVSRR